MIWQEKGEFIIRYIDSFDISTIANYFNYDFYVDEDFIYIHKSLLQHLDTFLYNTLQVPEIAHFDIVVDLTLSKGYDILCYDNYRDGNGLILPSELSKSIITLSQLDSQYLMPSSISSKFVHIKESIDVLNDHLTKNKRHSVDWFMAILSLQSISNNTSLLLHSSLLERTVEIPDEIQIDIRENESDPNTISIHPYIESRSIGKIPIDLEIAMNRIEFQINRYIRKNNKNVKVVLKENIKNDLSKLKEKSTISISKNTVDSEFLSDPNAFLNVPSIDFSSLSDRVIEIGKYNPQYYSFLIPGSRGKWIPNIQIENSVNGKKSNIQIETLTELNTFNNKIVNARSVGGKSINWKGKELPIHIAETLSKKFEYAFQKAKDIRAPNEHETDAQTLVLVIHENATKLEYSEFSKHDIELSPSKIDFKLFEVSNLKQKIKLRDHQKKGVATIQYLMSNHLDYKGVLLADDMGLGKTIQVLYLIEYYAQTKGKIRPCIIVAPVSLLKNWEEEYSKFFDNRSYKIKVVRGGDIPKGDHQDHDVLEELRKPNLILTNYETFRDAQLSFGQIDFGVMAIDEAQRIKTPGTMITSAIKAAKAEFKIAMTGTPVENTMVDLWSIMDYIQPGLFQSAKTFHNTYQKPMENASANHEALATNLRNKIGLQFIRRLKVDVAKDLPSKKIHQKYCPLTETQIEYYTKVSNEYRRLKSNSTLTFIHKLKLLCDCPLLLQYNLSDLSANQLTNSTARLIELKLILEDIYNKGEKVIIFSEYRKTQNMLKKVVREWFHGYNSDIINGTTLTEDTRTQLSRQSLIDQFQAALGFGVIIMSPIAAGVGLNVTAANHVVHYSRHWNPAKEAQATDRAYRIGQTKEVHVYYLLSTHSEYKTFDVILADLLKKKEQLSDASMYPSITIEVSDSELVAAFDFADISGKSFNQNYYYSEIIKFEPILFEAAIGAIYLSSGSYDKVCLTPRNGDKGADVICFSEKENLLIQVKQSKHKINADGLKDLEIAQLFYSNYYKEEFKSILISNSTLTKGAQEVLAVSKTTFSSVRKLMSDSGIESISNDSIIKIKNSRIPSFV